MSVVPYEASTETREDFPFDSYVLLDSRLQPIRVLVMDVAARLAKQKAEGATQVTVSREDVAAALVAIADETETIRKILRGETMVNDRR